jgi:hypothetical protein
MVLGHRLPLVCRMGIPILLEHLRHPIQWMVPVKLVLTTCVTDSLRAFIKDRSIHFAIVGLVLLPHREVLFDAFVSAGLPDKIQVICRKVCEMLGVLFIFIFGPFVAVVVVPMCEDVVAASMEIFDECGY